MKSEAVRATTTGATVMFFFGAIWLTLGLYAGRPSPISMRVGLLLAGIVLAAGIGMMVMRLARQSPSTAIPSVEQAAVSREKGRRFGWISAIEGGAIFLIIVLLNVAHRPQYIAPLIAVIVGLHFFPLAGLFGRPVYYVTGLLGCAIGTTGLLISDPALRTSFVGLSFGSLLWLTVAAVLVECFSLKTT